MTKPPAPGHIHVYDDLTPPFAPGTHKLSASLEVTVVPSLGGAFEVIATSADPASSFTSATIEVSGPHFTLEPTDIARVYPEPTPPDAGPDQGAADVMLPHVVLRRRTLPWERVMKSPGPAGASVPWMAVLLFWPGEAKAEDITIGTSGSSSETARLLTVPVQLLRRILPRRSELHLLAHARRIDTSETAAAKDDDGFVAYVIGNRLPKPNDQRPHLACLVSLENLDDQDHVWPDATTPAAGTQQLVVLHHWTFMTAKDSGDFEAAFDRLAARTTPRPADLFGLDLDEAGQPLTDRVLGRLELPAPTADDPSRTLQYSSPLAPVALAHDKQVCRHAHEALLHTMGGKVVVSYAAAFELGRLLTLANAAALRDLLRYRRNQLTAVPHLDDLAQPPGAMPTPVKASDRMAALAATIRGRGPGVLGPGGHPDPEWPERLDVDLSGMRHLVGVIAGLTPELLAAGRDADLARVAAGESWSDTAAQTLHQQRAAGVDRTRPDLADELDKTFADVAALAARGVAR